MSSFAEKRVWFITGCSSGIGRNLAEAILESGERVVATLRKPAALSSLAEKYTPDQLLILPLDVQVSAQIDDAFDKVKQHFGRLDVVVNNAGYGLSGEVEGIPEKDARAIVEVLFWGAVNVSKKAVAFFREVNPAGLGGRVLQITSIGGFIGNATLSYYSAALEGFTEAFSKELDPEWNIKMTIIEPGGVRTEWAGASMITVPQHPAYAHPSSTVSKRRAFMKDFVPMSDAKKAANAIIEISKVPNPPMRLPLGPDANALITAECQSVIDEIAGWKELSLSTLADDADGDMSKILSVVNVKKN